LQFRPLFPFRLAGPILILSLLFLCGLALAPLTTARALPAAPSETSNTAATSAFGAPVTFQNESSHYCTEDTIQSPDCISSQAPLGNPVDAYEFKLTLRNPASDGSAAGSFTGTSGSLSLTTTYSEDVIYVAVSSAGNPTVSISDGDSLTWTQRSLSTVGTAGEVATFYAISTSPLSADKITVYVSSTESVALMALGISGANTASPFDPGPSVPAKASGTSGNPAVSISTTYGSELVINSAFVGGNPAVTAGAGYSLVKTQKSGGTVEGSLEAGTASSAGSHAAGFSLATTTYPWAIVSDAVVGGGNTGGAPYLWYLHFPTCNCTVAPDKTPINTTTQIFSNGTMVLKDILSANDTTILTLTFNSNTGVQELVLNNLFAVQHVTGVLMAFLYNGYVQNGESLTFTPYGNCGTTSCSSDYVARPNGVYLTNNYEFSYEVYGSVSITSPAGVVLGTAAPGTLLHRWGDLNQYQGYEQLEDSWEISASLPGATQPAFVMDLGDIIDNQGARSQLGGILWLGNMAQQPLGMQNGEPAYDITQPTGQTSCADFVLSIPTSEGTISGTLAFHADFGGGCAFEHGWFTGSLSLGSTIYTVTGVASEFYCSKTTLIGCNNTPIASTTALGCTPNPDADGEQSVCTATVTSGDTALTPTGNVTFSSSPSGSGSFDSTACTLSPVSGETSEGQCSVTYTPLLGSTGQIVVTSTYAGDVNHATSSSSSDLSADLRTTSTSVGCSPTTMSYDAQATCTVGVTDSSPGTSSVPTGTVAVSESPTGSGELNSTACTLSAGACSVTFLSTVTGGTVTISASFAGDTNHSGSSGSAQISIEPPSTTLTATLNSSSVVVGGSIFDNATLSGVTSDAGGTITFYYSASSVCALSGAFQVGPQVEVNGPGNYSSSSALVSPVGTYYWFAVYSGDLSNAGTVSNCEPLAVVVSVPSVSAQLSSTSISVGGSVSDSASLMGSFNASGSVTYQYYSGGICEGTPAVVSTVTVTAGNVPSSGPQAFDSVGAYSWSAYYGGDQNNQPAQGPCQPLTVVAASPTLSIELSSGNVPVGANVSGTAALEGSFEATGTATFEYFAGSSCQGTPTTVSTVIVAGGNVSGSGPEKFDSAGLYSWSAYYSGDQNNQPAQSQCVPLTVTQLTPSISTSLSSSSIYAGESVFDTSTLAGESDNAGGTVAYQFYGTSSCTGTPTQVGSPVVVTGGSVPSSSPQVFSSAGAFSWDAVYSGDSNNAGSTSQCEPLTVLPVDPTSTSVSATSSVVLMGGTTKLTAMVKDTAASGATAPQGIVTWTITSGGGTLSSASCGLTAVSGKPLSECSVTFTAPIVIPPVTTTVRVTYAPGTYPAHSSSYGKETLTITNTVTTVSPVSTTQTLGDTTPTTYTATVTGEGASPTTPTGTVSWSDGGKSGTFSDTVCTLSGSGASASCTVTYTPSSSAKAGKITITATYSGDSAHVKSSGAGELTLNKLPSSASSSPASGVSPSFTKIRLAVTKRDTITRSLVTRA
jgi:hypothetical protein